jgi:hypothetical protein
MEMPVFTKCECKPVRHVNLFRSGRILNIESLFSLEDCAVAIENLSDSGMITPDEADILRTIVPTLDLPERMSHEEVLAEDRVLSAIALLAFRTPQSIEENLAETVGKGILTPQLAERIRDEITKIPRDKKIAFGVKSLGDAALDHPVNQANFDANIDPELLDEILDGARAMQEDRKNKAKAEAIDFVLKTVGFLRRDLLEKKLLSLLSAKRLGADLAQEIRASLDELTEEKKIALAVDFLMSTSVDPDAPEATHEHSRVCDADLVPAILDGFKEAKRKERENALLEFAFDNFGFYKSEALEAAIDIAVAEDQMSEADAAFVRAKIEALTDDEKVALAVKFLSPYDVEDRGTRRFLDDSVEEHLIPKILDAVKKDGEAAQKLGFTGVDVDVIVMTPHGSVRI